MRTPLHVRAASTLSTAIGGLILLTSLTAHSQVTQEWVARFDGAGTGDDRANAIAVDAAGNVYVTGQAGISGSSVDYATIKYNAQGVQQWIATYNGPGNSTDIATSIVVDASGNVYVTGASIGNNSSDEDYATIKYDPSGTEQWVARYNGPGNALDEPFDLEVDDLGNVYVTGRSNRTGGHFEGLDFLTIKYNALGAEQWVVRFNGVGNDWDEGRALAVDDQGNVYVTGTAGFDAGTAYHDDYTFKYNSSGGLLWVAMPNEKPQQGAVRTALAGRGHATLIRATAAARAAADIFEPLDPIRAALSKRLKDSFDPNGVLNPGRIYAEG